MLGDIDVILSGLSKLHALQTKGGQVSRNLVRFEEAQCIAKHNVEPWDKHNDPNIVQMEPSRMDVAARRAQLSDQSIKPPAAQLSNNVPVTKRQRLIAAKSRGLDAACRSKSAPSASAASSRLTATAAKRMQDGPQTVLGGFIQSAQAELPRLALLRKELHAPAPTEDWHIPEAGCVSPRKTFRMAITQ